MKLQINRQSLILIGDVHDNNKVWNELLLTAHKANLTILTTAKHDFYPQGFSGVIIIGESHVAIHTFPESRQAWIEIATCSETDEDVKRFIERLTLSSICEKLDRV